MNTISKLLVLSILLMPVIGMAQNAQLLTKEEKAFVEKGKKDAHAVAKLTKKGMRKAKRDRVFARH